MMLKEDCYWYYEGRDMGARLPFCKLKKGCNPIEPEDCADCEKYHSRYTRTNADRIRSMTDEEMAEYIDRKAVIKEMSNRWNVVDDQDFCNKEVWHVLEEFPAADVAPVKHGRWVEEPNCFYRCSECGEHYPSIKGYMSYHYCPNCGAKMEGVSDG